MDTQNKVMLNHADCIEIFFIGHQDAETFRQTFEKAMPLVEQLKSEGKPLLGLFDLTAHTGYSLSSDKAALEYLEKIKYDRIAMYHVPHAEVTKGIIMAIGKSDTTKLFDSRAEAAAWLTSDLSAT